MEITLCGVKPTGPLHMGNYLGAIKPFIEMQSDVKLLMLADLHAMTTPLENAGELSNNMYRELSQLIPGDVTLFRQSRIKDTTELMWILLPFISKAKLDHCHANQDGINAATYLYPVLMAADILIYGANYVVVGPDQLQHIEIARGIANSFNAHYGKGANILTVPKAVIVDDSPVKGLDGRKMSKSYGNVIPLGSDEKQLKKLINRIKTDSKSVEEPKDPRSCHLFYYYELFGNGEQLTSMYQRYQNGIGYGEVKRELCDVIYSWLRSIKISEGSTATDESIHTDAVSFLVASTMGRVRKVVGIY